MPWIITLMALTALELSDAPVYEPSLLHRGRSLMMAAWCCVVMSSKVAAAIAG
jgi:hypothetical protein